MNVDLDTEIESKTSQCRNILYKELYLTSYYATNSVLFENELLNFIGDYLAKELLNEPIKL